MKNNLSLLMILFICTQMNAQGVKFNKAFGNNGFDTGRDVAQDANDNYFIVGYTGSAQTGDNDVLLFSLDENGEERWSHYFGTTQTDIGTGIVITEDNNLMIVGHTNGMGSGGYDIYVAKISLEGDLLWETTYGGTSWDFGYDIIHDGTGKYLIVGQTYSNGNGNSDAYVLKIDGDGEIVWEETYGDVGDQVARSIEMNSNSEFVFIGEQELPEDDLSYAWLAKINQSGDLIWEYVHDEEISENEIGRDLFFEGEDVIALSNVPDADAASPASYMWRLDSTNEVVWHKSRTERWIYSLFKKEDNKMGAVGSDPFDAYLVFRSISSGSFIPSPANSFDVNIEFETFYSVIPTSDNGFICVGEANIGDGQISAFVAKFDSTLVTADGTELVDIPVGVSEVNINKDLDIYPNPAKNILNFTLKESERNARVILYNSNGAIVLEEKLNGNQSIDINGLSQGIYQVFLIQDNTLILSKKLVVE